MGWIDVNGQNLNIHADALPFYGIMIADYYMIRNRKLDVEHLFTAEEGTEYFYDNGWNRKALIAFVLPAIFSVMTVWIPTFASLEGFSWVIGTALGAVLYYLISKKAPEEQVVQ
ncbi:cytosine permease [Grimontia marina]|uniref:Putative allantoin permease n=1 Tax=Grimontia marina TaxID=646534 RepID=A0A128FHV3_9GAMM|nr:cytosine permease [Grimontia marina]CZF86140.1 putative allantoin permease [Grimontia marina]